MDNKNVENLVALSLLYDFYGELLTKHQKQIYADFILNDYSLGEIAEEQGLTRQGVHDLIRRCNRALESYEAKLHLVERFQRAKEKIDRLNLCVAEAEERQDIAKLEEIKTISASILEEF